VHRLHGSECPYAFAESGVENWFIGPLVTHIGEGAFQDSALRKIEFHTKDTMISMLPPEDIEAGQDIIDSWPEKRELTIGQYAFSGCYYAEGDLIIPDNIIAHIGDYAFKECSFESIYLGDDVVDVGTYAFDCSNVKTLTIGTNVTTIGEKAFLSSKMETITIKSNIVHEIYTMSNLPPNSLTAIYVPANLVSDYKSANNAFIIISSKIQAIS